MRHLPHLILAGLVAMAAAGTAAPSKEQVEAAARDLLENARKELQATGIPGMAITVVYGDEVILAEGLGVREVGKDSAVDADTRFQLASLSKPIASTVVAALVGKSLVEWDSRISDLDPKFEMFTPWVTRELTIRDLFSHRSGLPDHAGDLLEDLGYSREEILHRLRFQPPSSSFRSGYAYTNFGLTEGAVAAATPTGKDWETLSEDVLYKPLGMTSTSSRFSDFANSPNHAVGHQQVDGKWVHRRQRQPDAQSPAGGVSSTANDLAKWIQLQINGGRFKGEQIVEEAALTETHRPVIFTQMRHDGLPAFYGLGWEVLYDNAGRLRLSHSGAFDMGAATFVGIIPSEKLGVAILTNASPIGVPEALGQTFFDQVLEGKPTRDWFETFKNAFAQMAAAERSSLPAGPPANPTPPAPLEKYLGRYENDFIGPIEIRKDGDGLAIAMGPKPIVLPMSHWDRDTFTYTPVGEMTGGRYAITFTLGLDGAARQVWVENLDATGLGTLRRVSDAP